MTHHPATGGATRLPEPARTLIAAEDGIYLWPGILLVHKGCAINRNNAYEQLARFYGPSHMLEAKLYDLEDAARFLTRADVTAVQHGLDMLEFPPISPNGALLMQAIAKRQRLPVPGVPVGSHQYGTRWDAAFAAQIAPLFDDLAVKAQALAKRFVPGVAKGYDPDEPRDDHGRWTTGGGDDTPSLDTQAMLDGMSAAASDSEPAGSVQVAEDTGVMNDSGSSNDSQGRQNNVVTLRSLGITDYGYTGNGPATLKGNIYIYADVPDGAIQYTTPDGSTFYAPPGASFATINVVGQQIAQLPLGAQIPAINNAVGHFGTFDFQRHDGVFYTKYTDASNYAVGVLMQGAGFSTNLTVEITGRFASSMSNQGETSRQQKWWVAGWNAAANNNFPKRPR